MSHHQQSGNQHRWVTLTGHLWETGGDQTKSTPFWEEHVRLSVTFELQLRLGGTRFCKSADRHKIAKAPQQANQPRPNPPTATSQQFLHQVDQSNFAEFLDRPVSSPYLLQSRIHYSQRINKSRNKQCHQPTRPLNWASSSLPSPIRIPTPSARPRSLSSPCSRMDGPSLPSLRSSRVVVLRYVLLLQCLECDTCYAAFNFCTMSCARKLCVFVPESFWPLALAVRRYHAPLEP